MSTYPLISIVVPALNESETIRELYERTRAVFNGGQPFEFIVIDDGSHDDTFAVLQKLQEDHGNIVAIRHSRNLGKSVALMQGFDTAAGDICITMDADLQDQPEMIPLFLDKLEEGFDMVNGWRTRRKDTGSKRFVSYLFNRLTWWVLKCPLHDINCGFKAMHRRVYKTFELQGDFHRIMPALAMIQGFRVSEVPVAHSRRMGSSSRYPLLRYVALLDVFAARFGDNIPWRSFHGLFKVSLFFWLLAVGCLAGWLGIQLFFSDQERLPGIFATLIGIGGIWSLFIGSLLPIIGLQIDILTRAGHVRSWREKSIEKKIGTGEK